MCLSLDFYIVCSLRLVQVHLYAEFVLIICSEQIYFHRLHGIHPKPIGIFGSRQEVVEMLLRFNAISELLADCLLNDNDNNYLQPGIHGMLTCPNVLFLSVHFEF